MGQDKAALLVDGVPLASRPAAALSVVACEVLLAGGEVAGVPGRAVADLVEGAGPLAGLVSALAAARTPLLVAAACDMPSLQPRLLRLLIELLGSDPRRVAVACRTGAGLEPFPVALRVAEARRLRDMLDRGARAVHEALIELDPLILEPFEWAAVDPNGASFVNWNRPEDVRQALAGPLTIRADD